jgi:DNA polymerase III delta prime subunit
MFADTSVDSGPMRPENEKNDMQRWSCDVCKVATFSDFDEACRHEKACQKQQEAALAKIARPGIVVKKKKEKITVTKKNAPTKKAVAKPPTKTEKNKVHSFFAPPKKAPNALTTTTASTEPRKRKSPKTALLQLIDSDNDDTHAKKQKQSKVQPSIFFDLSQSSDEKKSKLAVAAIFDGKSQKYIMAEQRAIEQAARRHVEERQQQQSQQQVATQPKKAVVIVPKEPVPERFPVPSHVLGEGISEGADSKQPSTSGKYSEARAVLCQTPKHPSGVKAVGGDSPCSNLRGPEIAPVVDPIFQLLSSVLSPPKRAVEVDDHRVWTEKYKIHNIPYDVAGQSNKKIAESCVSFVDEWKLERQKAHERRAEKQEKLVYGKKKRRSKKKESYDDELNWDESDEELMLPAVCLLRGPVGCGKTSLVHAVAKHCECKVMEINTTGKRGSQNLKNAIEEATQSDSTLDLLKKTAAPVFIGKQQQKLVDTDDEDEELREGSAVPVILIDEVDLLFEEDGDAGFWSTLKALSKKAKCPIFLTANTIPVALISLTMRFKHYVLERPSPRECMEKTWQVIKSERFAVRKKTVELSEVKRSLTLFAELCECDVRRMIQVLHLFSKCRKVKQPDLKLLTAASTSESETELPEDSAPMITAISPKCVPVAEQTLLKISGLHFRKLPSNFTISVGNQKCSAVKIINDATILAVCPPFRSPKELDRFGMFKESGRRSLSYRHPVVTVDAGPRAPHLKRGSNLQEQELYDGSKITSLAHWTIEYLFPDYTWKNRDDSSSSESVDEVGVPKVDHAEAMEEGDVASEHILAPSSLALIEAAEKDVIKIDEEVILPVPRERASVQPDAIDELSRLADSLQFQSDITLMEQSISGLPLLAGTSRGFGSVLVDGLGKSSSGDTQKLCRNDNAKPPSNERIFLNGWNDDSYFFGDSDAYMTNPCSRQRTLFPYTAVASRGYSMAVPSQSPDSEEEGLDVAIEVGHSKQSTCLADEEAFLIRESSLATLPSVMRHLLDGKLAPEDVRNNLLRTRREDTMRKTNQFLRSLWLDPNISMVFARGIARQVDPGLIVSEDRMDEKVVLDYAPILTNICVFEKSAIDASKAAVADPEESVSRRSTRRSKAMVRAHYFGSVNPVLCGGDTKQMGEERAKFLLQY